jgi:SAM-dependent methyltransferase
VRRVAALLAALGGLVVAGAWLRRQPRAHDAAGRLRTGSSPSARLYGTLAGALLAGLYERVALDAAAAVDGAEAAHVLEVGPGPGHVAVQLARLSPGVQITGLDIDPAMVAAARARALAAGLGERIRFIEGDVAAIPFPDATFDLVLSSFSAHHWRDAQTAFREIHRVLRPGRMAIVYDLPDGWGRFETGSMGLGQAAAAGGFDDGHPEPVAWPRGLRLVRRLQVTRAA